MTCQARESMAVTIAAKQLIAELKETSEASGRENKPPDWESPSDTPTFG